MQLTELQLDYLKEIINIGVGRSADVLNKVVKNRVLLQVPVVQVIKVSEINNRIGYDNDKALSIVSMNFQGELLGKSELIFPSSSAVKIVDLLTDKVYPNLEMDDLRSSSLNEVGNIVLSALIGSIGNVLKIRFNYSIPKYKECLSSEIANNYDSASDYVIFAETHFSIKDNNIDGSFILFFVVKSFEHFIELINQSLKNPYEPR
jgi:chemotaxis protein CheC